MREIPNREWYGGVSSEQSLGARCPFATVEACPRYYQSLSLLGEAGSTKIPEPEDRRLLNLWKASDLWPRTDELATSMAGPDGSPSIYSNFCPEVAFERFGYFATSLTRYPDGIDSALAHERLSRERVVRHHPSWSWASCTAQHFSECQVYAVLQYRSQHPAPSKPATPEPWWRKYISEIVVAVVIAIVGIVVKVLT